MVAGLWLAAASFALAQRQPAAFPAPTPAPTEGPALRQGTGHTGSYQGLDGGWHTVLVEGWENDRVYLSDAGSMYKAYGPTELKRIVVLGDPIAAAHEVMVQRRRFLRLPRPVLVPAAVERQMYRGGGFQLLQYDHPTRPATLASTLSSKLLLRRGNEAWQVLPSNTAKFNQRMLVLLGSDPELIAGLQTGQYRPRREAAELLERDADRQTRQFLKSAA